MQEPLPTWATRAAADAGVAGLEIGEEFRLLGKREQHDRASVFRRLTKLADHIKAHDVWQNKLADLEVVVENLVHISFSI